MVRLVAYASAAFTRKEWAKVALPTGWPRKRTAVVILVEPGVVSRKACISARWEGGRSGRGDDPVVEVRSFVLEGFRTTPRGLPSTLKRSKKNVRSKG